VTDPISTTIHASVKQLMDWWDHPPKFVRDVFDATPDAWQDNVLAAFPHNPRLAMSAAKGPGKSALLAWLAWNFLLTRPSPRIAATSITGLTLADTLWAEMAKWQNKSPILQAAFEWQKTRIFARHEPSTWFMTARSWSRTASAQEQAHTLAGLHADYIMFLIDEAGGVPDAVMAAAEAALASCKEGHLVIAGNPTHLEGPLYRAFHTEQQLWHLTSITGDPDDPNRSPRISVQWARDQITKYGRDNPWVLVNVFGRFPPGSINALIGPAEVQAAVERFYRDDVYRAAPRILGVDVARYGDDSSIIFPRQGLMAFPPAQHRNIDSITGANLVARKTDDWNADAIFIDDTGGYGAGWIDNLRRIGKDPIGVPFSAKALDRRYYNKRAEMYFELVQWIRDGGSIPNVPELAKALSQLTYSFKGDSMILEDKDQLKERLHFSPDHADALALTFAMPVAPRQLDRDRMSAHRSEYDPFAKLLGGDPMKDENWSPFS
jgi:hypothetical protein